ncbi:MAG: hypothetical protein E7004_02125 [Alphaproteobacteria bacterium]|nr:hypothetical protein [Alphaproteobacteria bacterium]MBE6467374.1 hypothetical protein [Alphaproteobacteria bacterium]
MFQGVRLKGNRTEFCVYAPKAQQIELCLFSDDEKSETKIPMTKGEDGIWHIKIEGNLEGQKYGYRGHGEYNPDNKCFFNPNKLLVDPYAYEVTKSLNSLTEEEKEILTGDNDKDSALVAPKSVVRFLDKASLEKKYPYLYKKPKTDWGNTHIYELNVGNFTAEHPEVKQENRGRLKAISEMVEYFKDMNYNQIELMPITPTMVGKQIVKDKGLIDQWGYNPINHNAIDPRYGNIYDFLEMVNNLHKNGIEVCVDVVYNHTGEFGPDLYLLSYKGLDAESYYRYSPHDNKSFVNTTGCGNTFNPNTTQGGKIVEDSLMFLADVCGVDAFRFDLAGDCALDNNLQFNPNGNFMRIVNEVKAKTGVKMSGEPWSAVGGYFLGEMKDIHEWNDKHEKTLRRFIRGEHGQVCDLARYMAGGGVNNKINIFTKHDGVTQYDWVSYFEKNNYENNEENRDGSNDNYYSPSENEAQKLVKTKTAHALNVLARGVPLSLSGDEIWHTQGGNNNGYARSFPIKWKDLSAAQKERYLFERKINAFRQAHPIFCKAENVTTEVMPNGKPRWEWFNINGEYMQQNDWDFYENRFLAYVLNGQNRSGKRFDDDFLVMTSGNACGNMDVRLPELPHNGHWRLVFDTAKETSHKDDKHYQKGDVYSIAPHSVVVFTNQRPEQRENQNIRPTVNLKLGGR